MHSPPEWRNWHTQQTQNLPGPSPVGVQVPPPASFTSKSYRPLAARPSNRWILLSCFWPVVRRVLQPRAFVLPECSARHVEVRNGHIVNVLQHISFIMCRQRLCAVTRESP